MRSKTYRVLIILICAGIWLTGCDRLQEGEFPGIFSNIGGLDPAGNAGSGGGDVKVFVKDAVSGDYVGRAAVDLYDGDVKMTEMKPRGSSEGVYGYTDFTGLVSGRHLINVYHERFLEKNVIVNVVGSDMELTVSLQPREDAVDRYEDNDNYGIAYYLNDELNEVPSDWEGSNLYNEYIYATLHEQGDNDWYEIEVGYNYGYSSGYIEVKLEDIPIGHDYDLELYENIGYVSVVLKRSSVNLGNMAEAVEYWNSSAQSFFARVYPADSGSFSDKEYSLHIKAITP